MSQFWASTLRGSPGDWSIDTQLWLGQGLSTDVLLLTVWMLSLALRCDGSRLLGEGEKGTVYSYEVFSPHFSCILSASCPFLMSGGGLVAKSCLTIATPWIIACQALLSMELSRQEYWSGLPFPSPGDLPYPGIEPRSPAWQVDSLPTELWMKPNPLPNFEPGFPHLKSQGGLGRGTLGFPPPRRGSRTPHPSPTPPDSHPLCGHIWICLAFWPA